MFMRFVSNKDNHISMAELLEDLAKNEPEIAKSGNTIEKLQELVQTLFPAADANKDGKLNAEEMVQMSKAMKAEHRKDVQSPKEPYHQEDHEISDMFMRSLDKDQDNHISMAELFEDLAKNEAHIADTGKTLEEFQELVQTLFPAADANKDGKLNAKEMVQMSKAMKAEHRKHVQNLQEPYHPENPGINDRFMRTLDKDKDQHISMAELFEDLAKNEPKIAKSGKTLKEFQELVRNMFPVVDANKDGKLNAKEMVEMSKAMKTEQRNEM